MSGDGTLAQCTETCSPRRRGGGERFSRLRSSVRVSDQGEANRGTDFSRPHLQGAVGMCMNCQVRARLVFRRDCFGVVGPKRASPCQVA